ncbi:MAG: extracellular solute-binding protein [Provencibacterium sp.]|jgi:putative aldouronate transport system substrate-binding protein|nr:extracellular solute-binding protein [Provencibacterium sp.]
MKTKRSSRLWAAPLAALLLLTPACSEEAPPASSAPAPTPASRAESEASSAAQPQTIAGLVEGKEKPVLRQLNIYLAKDYNTYPTAQVIEEGTGYQVEYDMLPSDGAADKLNLIMATQEPYDIVVYGGDSSLIMNYAKEGALADLNPWLPMTAYLKDAINDYERDTFTLDGGLYAIGMQTPTFDGKSPVTLTTFVRQDYLDAMGRKMPDTLEGFQELLTQFKSFDNGTGSPTIPYTVSASNVILEGIIGAFGMPTEWNEADGRLCHRAADPRMKDYLAYMKNLYQQGLIDVDYPANQSANVFEKFSTGVAASAFLSCYDYQNFADTMAGVQPGAKIGYLPPLKGPDGTAAVGSVSGGMDRIAFIPKVTKNIEHVIHFMDLKLEPELFESITIGEEGTHYTVNESGELWPILPAFTDERGSSVNYYTGRPAAQYAEYWKLRVKKRADIWDCWNFINNDPSYTGVHVSSAIGYAPVFASSQNVSSLNALFSDTCLKIIAGSSAVEEFDAMTANWLEQGGRELTADYNEWWAGYQK